MRTDHRTLAVVALVAGILGPAGAAVAHPFDTETIHECTGRSAYDNRNGVIRQDLGFTLQGEKTYLSLYVDRATGKGGPGTAVWMESNGLDWLQKEDFLCSSGADTPTPHSDTRLL